MKKYFLLITAAFVLPLYGAVLVQDGKAVSEIIIGKDPSRAVRMAAHELQYHIRLMSGATLPICAAAGDKSVKIFIGGGEGFKRQEYLVEVKGDRITLSGSDSGDRRRFSYNSCGTFPGYWQENGPLYAVYDFLEALGVRWYLPTEIGIVYDKQSTVKCADMRVRRTPSFLFRDTMALAIPGDLCGDTVGERREAMKKTLDERERRLWFLRQRHGGVPRELNHSLYSFYKRFHAKHPDWFAKGWQAAPDMQLCYTHPGVIAQVVQDARDFFDGKIKDARALLGNFAPGYRSDCYPLGAMDNRRWCKCERCMKLLTAGGADPFDHSSNSNVSEYWYTFVSKVALELQKSHPDKLVGTMCYSGYTMPPQLVKLPGNVLIRPAVNVAYFPAAGTREYIRKLLTAWRRKAPDALRYISIWYCYPNVLALESKSRYFPRFIGRQVKDYFKLFREFGAQGMFWEPSYCTYGAGPMFDMVDGYINWRLAWDIEADGDRIYDELFDKFYGPAAGAMKEFYRLAETFYSDQTHYTGGSMIQNHGLAWGHIGTGARMKQLQNAVDRAVKSAVAEPYRQRVEIFRNTLWAYMLKGRAEYCRQQQLAAELQKRNMIANGDMSGTLPGHFANWGKVVSGGVSGNALQVRCAVNQGRYWRTANLNIPLNKDGSGRYRFSGMVKGGVVSVWSAIYYRVDGRRRSRNFSCRKERMSSGQEQWRQFRFDLELPPGSKVESILFQVYGSKNAVVLVDDLQLSKIEALKNSSKRKGILL